MLIVALVAGAIFSMGGVIFGIASLYPVLYYEGALEDTCTGRESSCLERTAEVCPVEGAACAEKCCEGQQVQYTIMSSVALFVADGAMLLYGELADRMGPRYCFGVGACLSWMGFVFLAMAHVIGADWAWYLATFAIGASGPGVFMGCLFLGEKHPHLHGVISAVSASMWDASALVLMLFNLVYFASTGWAQGEPPNASLPFIAGGWLLICVPLGAIAWRALPTLQMINHLRAAGAAGTQPLNENELAEPADVMVSAHMDAEGCVGKDDTSSAAKVDSHAEPEAMSATVEAAGAVQNDAADFFRCFCRKDTLLLLWFMSTYNLKSSFFITTFKDEVFALFNDVDTAERISTIFNLAFPLGGFLTSVVATVILNRLGEREDLYMLLVVVCALVLSFLNLLPYESTQLCAAVLFGPVRTLQWGCYFHFLSLPKRYPPQFVGRLLGYGNLVIAIAGDVPISLLNAFVVGSDIFDSAAARYVAVHAVLQLGLVCALALPWYLGKTLHRSNIHRSEGISPAEDL